MTKETFTLTGDDAVAVLTMSRPHCLDIHGKHELLEILRTLGERSKLRTVIITASASDAWLVDVAELVEMTPNQARAFSRAGHLLADALSNLPVPVFPGTGRRRVASTPPPHNTRLRLLFNC